MPRNFKNWTFDDAVSFLKQHGFAEIHTRGSHYYFEGTVDGVVRVVEVQNHAARAISVKSIQHDIAKKSGIPEKVWKEWANAGNKRLRKKIQYSGAE